MKTCTGCGETKPLDQFWADRAKRHGRMARCKTCKTAATRAYRQAHPELNKERYWSNRDAERERHLVKKYGVTFADYAAMLAAQDGRCAVCGRPEPDGRMLDVDHDHKTGQVRGLLCTSCNRMIGHAGDSVSTLISAARYLKSCQLSRRRSSGRSSKRKQ